MAVTVGPTTVRPRLVESAPPEREPFVVMAKPVGPACNLDCSYCYYLESFRLYERPHRFRMSDDMLERYVRQFIEASPGPIVHFVWHGGEPTLAGLRFYERAVELQRRYLPEGWQCWNNLQTNGTLLDDAWCAFLAKERFEVGLSLDGPAVLHDANRLDRAGRGTHARVMAGLRRLLDHGVEPDLLCTVNAATAAEPLTVYRYLRDLGPTFLQFLPVVRLVASGRASADSVTPHAYGRFLCVVFDEWLRRDTGRLMVQAFGEYLRVWAGEPPLLCLNAETCGRVLVVEHDGAVYSCDHYVRPEHRLGNISSAHLGALVDSPAQLRFGQAKRESLASECRACPWLAACNGGCPKHRLAAAADGEGRLNYLCGGLRAFFAHADPYLRRMVVLGRPGWAAVTADLRAADRARWQGLGRNDPCPCGSGLKAKRCCWSIRP